MWYYKNERYLWCYFFGVHIVRISDFVAPVFWGPGFWAPRFRDTGPGSRVLVLDHAIYQDTSEWISTDLHLLKVNTGNTRNKFEIYSKLKKVYNYYTNFEHFSEYKKVSKCKKSSEPKNVSEYKNLNFAPCERPQKN